MQFYYSFYFVVKGAVTIDQVTDSELLFTYVVHLCFWFIEKLRPTMKDLNRYVVRKHATDWYDIGIELDLELDVLDIIKKDNPQESVTCFQNTLNKWQKLNSENATWKTLEVALTNVQRIKVGLDPVDDVYKGSDLVDDTDGMDVHKINISHIHIYIHALCV